MSARHTCDAALNPNAPVTNTALPPTPSHPIPPRPLVPGSGLKKLTFSLWYTALTPNFPCGFFLPLTRAFVSLFESPSFPFLNEDLTP